MPLHGFEPISPEAPGHFGRRLYWASWPPRARVRRHGLLGRTRTDVFLRVEQVPLPLGPTRRLARAERVERPQGSFGGCFPPSGVARIIG